MKKLSAIVLLLFNLFLHLPTQALDASFGNGGKLILMMLILLNSPIVLITSP